MQRPIGWILLTALLAAVAVACTGGNKVGEEKLEPKAAAGGDQNRDKTAEGAAKVAQGDTVVIELTIYHPPFVYLTGDPPVAVLTPTIPGWEFEKQLFKLQHNYFPMQIPVTIGREADVGDVKVRLGLRIAFAYKSDEKELTQNAVVEVPFNVSVQRGEKGGRRVRVPVEYMLKISDEIDQEPVN